VGESPVRAPRDDVVVAATRVFSELGYHGASMEDIAAALGMRKASLYHHVRSKEDLLYIIHEGLIEQLISAAAPIATSDDPPAYRLAALIRMGMHFISTNRAAVTVFLQGAGSLGGDRWDRIVEKRNTYERMVARILADGVADGSFVQIDSVTAARGILGMVNWCYTWFDPDGELQPEDVADTFSRLVLTGLTPEAGC